MEDIAINEFGVPFTIEGRWKVVVNPETARSGHPMRDILVAKREDGLGIYAHHEPYRDRYWMRKSGEILAIVGNPPFADVIGMADKEWPFEEKADA
jgi:hypothetical protein